MKRTVIGGAVIAALAVGAVAAAVSYEPPGPGDCAALRVQADHSSDAAVLVEEAGCETPAVPGHDLTARP